MTCCRCSVLPHNKIPVFAKYQTFLRLPDVAVMALVAALARMPIGMVGLSMLMLLRQELGNFQLAASAVGAYFIAMAISGPLLGRAIDRHGPRLFLLVTGVVQPIVLAALFAATIGRLPSEFIVLSAFQAGAFQPPITTLTRTLWRHRFDDENQRRIAFALDSIIVELNFTVGPALIALLLALAGPRVAFVTAWVAVVAASHIFLRSPAMKYWKHEPLAERHLLGPLTEWRLVYVFLLSFGLAFCFGMVEVGYPGFAVSLALPALGGIFLAINSIGSALGGVVYGGLHFKMSIERQFAATLGLIAIPLFLHALVIHPAGFGMVAFFAGAAIAPALTAQTVMVSRLAPNKYATEAFTWSSTFIVSGIGAGTMAGGAVIESMSVQAAFWMAGAIMASTSLAALLLRPSGNANS